MNTEQELVFPLNRTKIASRMLVQAVLIIAFIFLFKTVVENPKDDQLFLLILSSLMVVFWLSTLFLSLSMLLNKSPGLIINSTGIVDNTTGVSAGNISWDNIKNTYITQQRSVSFLTVEVEDPKQYLAQGNVLNRIFKRINYTFFHSPIHISAGALDISFNEMVEIIEQYYKKHGRSSFAK